MKGTGYVCPRCGNQDPRYFGKRNGEFYCRLCVTFQGKEAREYTVDDTETDAVLNYPLSPEQSKIANAIMQNFQRGISTLVHAVCGSGKTELVYGVISEALKAGKQVGFAVPRREVVIDLLPRFISAFPAHQVISVYGGHNDNLSGDIIILTTHQLYRYSSYFDLLILDEIDAFPFKDSTLLLNFFTKAVRGSFVMMSATPPDDVVKRFREQHLPILELHTRYHRHPLPIPKIVIRIGYLKIFYLIRHLKQYRLQHKPVMIFAPTISICESIYRLLKIIVKRGMFVHSKCDKRNEIIKDFKNHKYDYLVTTSVLERGVTIKNVQVIIYDADHIMYEKGVLIQIAGRAGRKIDAPTGEVTFLANKQTIAMKDAVKAINYDNSFL